MLGRIKFSILAELLPGNKEKSAKYHIKLKKSQNFGKVFCFCLCFFFFLVNTPKI